MHPQFPFNNLVTLIVIQVMSYPIFSLDLLKLLLRNIATFFLPRTLAQWFPYTTRKFIKINSHETKITLQIIRYFRMEEISILEVRTSSNAYFFKLANQNWSTTDYCYIETAARRHPDFNVRSLDQWSKSLEL